MEPRMRPRPKGAQFPPDDLSAILHAYGDSSSTPLSATIACLDSIVTDYIIEICHEASSHATYAGRAKVKQDDFQWALRKDQRKLGRVQELLEKEREMKAKRRIFEPEGEVGGVMLQEGEQGEDFEGPRKGVGRGRGRRKKRKVEEVVEGKEKEDDAAVAVKEESGKAAGQDDGDADLFGDED